MASEDIELYDCDHEVCNESPSPSVNAENDNFEPVIIYRKDKKWQRAPHARCIHPPRRILHKNGRAVALSYFNIPHRFMHYLRDFGNTMVNSRWRWITLNLVLTFAILWLAFGWFWMLIAQAHGDLEEPTRNDTCSVGNEGFAGFLLMSIETQTTIGYGSRYPTENCPEGIFMLCLQMILGIGMEGAILGMFYVKMTRPGSRDSLKLFSRIAVICQRDGNLCLMFRVEDKRRAHIVGTQLKAYLMETRRTSQGEYLENFQTPLKLEPHGLLLWPLTVVHKITPASPLYDLSAQDLLLKKFEIAIVMIGSSDSTGQMTQSRTSYTPFEIYWGHRFKSCVHFDTDQESYIIEHDLFNATEEVDTPLCSAQRLEEVLEEIQNTSNGTFNSAVPSIPTDSVSFVLTPPSTSPGSPIVFFDEILETDV
ncbi:Inwardly rectifying potassium channel 2 [Carabus blaptoides fortunei]